MKTLQVQCFATVVLFLSLFVDIAAHAQITPTGDAYTNSTTPTTNYGAKTLLDVDAASQISYIQFDLASIPSGASVGQATLKLYVNSVTAAGSFNVNFVNGTWSESTITSSNAPPQGNTIASGVAVTTAQKNEYLLINVTSAVQAWLDGSQSNDGLALVANSTFNATFDSKENTGTSHPPELDIVYAAIGGINTATGSGLVGGGTSGTLNLSLTNACSSNQVLQWNGSAWQCASVGTGTITGVIAGTSLTGGGTSGSVTLNVDTTKVPQISGGNSFSGNQSVSGNVVATGSVSGATASFSGSNSSQILNVTQNGAGLGIFSSNVAPLAAIYGTSSNASGVGVQGFNTASTGGTAMSAATNSIGGIALFAANGATSGNSLGIFAQTNSLNGTALFATNTAGGTAAKFGGPVNVAGNTSVTGNVSSTGQLISTVATGTAPLSVNSTTQVANLNASLLGGQSASAFATTGSNMFSGNQTVTGNLTATGVVTGSSYQIGSNLFAFGSYGNSNAFLGFAGNTKTTGCCNTAGGVAALFSNTTGSSNTASGVAALFSNTTGNSNTAMGDSALYLNTGNDNTASGVAALNSNTIGCCNTGSGAIALYSNSIGTGNTAEGYAALSYATGSNNTGLGTYAGNATSAQSTTGSSNTYVGYLSNSGTQLALNNATAIGANAEVDESNSMVLGSINGVNSATANTFVGIGTTAPTYLLHIGNQGGFNNFLRVEGPPNSSGNSISVGGHGDFAIDAVNKPAGRFVVKDNGIVAIGVPNPSINPFQIAQGLGHAIADGWDQYSSRRWKTNIHPLTDALGKVEHLRGVSYNLKSSGKHEIGVIAEEVGEVVPEVVSYEENGKDARGVDYSRLTALLIEAVKQQQKQIAAQQRLIHKLSYKVGVLESSLRSNHDPARSVLVSQAKTRSGAGQ